MSNPHLKYLWKLNCWPECRLNQDGDTDCSWLQLPSQGDQLATVYRLDTVVKIPEPRGEAEACCNTETEQDHIRRGRGLHSDHITPRLGRQSLTVRRPSWAYGFSSREVGGCPRWTDSSPDVYGCYLGGTLGSHLTEITGEICGPWPLRFRQKQRRSRGFTANNTQVLADHVAPCSSACVEIPDSGCIHLQSWAGGPVCPGSSVGSSAECRSPASELYQPWSLT